MLLEITEHEDLKVCLEEYVLERQVVEGKAVGSAVVDVFR